MKTKKGMILGFIAGMGGFLVLFKLFVLPHIAPTDEVAPGMVVIASVICGSVLAFIVRILQVYLAKKGL